MTEHDIRRAAALSKILREIPKQLEAIAERWEAEGRRLEAMDVPNAESVHRKCAAELRAYVATWKRAGEEP